MGGVQNGFPAAIDLASVANRNEYDRQLLRDNLLFGTPDEVIQKLNQYKDLGVDHFIYYASLGLGFKQQKRSLELFIEKVIPEFDNAE